MPPLIMNMGFWHHQLATKPCWLVGQVKGLGTHLHEALQQKLPVFLCNDGILLVVGICTLHLEG